MAVKRYNGSSWVVQSGSQGIVYAATSPSNPSIGDMWVSTADVNTFDSLVQTGNRNVLINGAFKIDQRNAGASQTFTAAAALAYSVDRWYGYCTGANITGARVAGTAPDQYYYRFTGAASNTAVGFGQRIEAASSYQFAGQTASLSVALASTSITTLTWTAYYATTTDTFGTLASPTRTQIATGTFTINSTLTRYNASISIPAAATTGIEIVFTCGALTATQTLTLSNAQLELSTAATPFEYRPIGQELSLCQRYYWRSEPDSLFGVVINAGIFDFRIDFPVEMRVRPLENNNITAIILGISPTATQVNVYNGAFTSVPTTYGGGATMSSKKGGVIRFSGGAGGTNGFGGRLLCGTSVYFDFDSEL